MAKRGRKSGFNARLTETIVRLSKSGKTNEQIADVLGISSRTLTNWMGKFDDLFLAVREARQVADELVEASLFSRALGYSHPEEKVFQYEGQIVTHETIKQYPPDTQAAMFWLRNRQPARWKEKTDSDVNVNNTMNVNSLTDEQIDAKIASILSKEKKGTK